MHFKLFEQFISEGGWASTKTQLTQLTPRIMKEVVSAVNELGVGFNMHLKSIDLPSVDILRPVGSGTWWKEDLIDQPDKTYGDIDFMVAYPTLPLGDGDERRSEIETVKLYNAELFNWLKKEKPKTVDIEESEIMSSPTSVKLLIVIDDNGSQAWVQTDLVVTHQGYADWALFRYTPVRNIKGFVLGNLYSAFGSVLDLSIQSRGVRAKFVKDVMVSQLKRKDVIEKLVSANITTFMNDIANFFWQNSGTSRPYQPSKRLLNWKIDPTQPSLESLIDGIKGVAETLATLGEFGTTIKYKSADDLLKAVAAEYEDKMLKTYNASKFEKAETPEAKQTVDKIRILIEDSIRLVTKLLS